MVFSWIRRNNSIDMSLPRQDPGNDPAIRTCYEHVPKHVCSWQIVQTWQYLGVTCRFFEITWFSKTNLNWKPFFLLVAYISFGFRVLRWTWNMGVHKGIPKSGSSKYRCFGSLDCFFLDISHRLKIETTHIFVNLAKKWKIRSAHTRSTKVREFLSFLG